MAKYKDEDWLRREYVGKGRNGTDIADECDVTHATIYYYLDKFDIEKRSRGFRKGKRHYNFKDAKEEYQCPVCGDIFQKRPTDVGETKHGPYCSTGCHNQHKREYMKNNGHSMSGEEHPLYNSDPEDNPMYEYRGENHWNWKGGYKQDFRDTTEWYHTRKDAIDRDGSKCVDCGLSRDEHRETFDRDLEVHHITPVSEGGEKYDMDNLATLCVPCHLERHRN